KNSVAGSRIALIGLGGIRSIRVIKPDLSKVSGISRTRLKSRVVKILNSIIIISRTREVTLKIVYHSDLIEVKPIEKSEALELL
ncbi:hypothetical protein N7472_004647, partial [Penicillium cf. griseofulvum]